MKQNSKLYRLTEPDGKSYVFAAPTAGTPQTNGKPTGRLHSVEAETFRWMKRHKLVEYRSRYGLLYTIECANKP